MDKKELWTICEREGMAISAASAELLSKGAELAAALGYIQVAIYFGTNEKLPIFPAEKAYILSCSRDTPDYQGRALAAAAMPRQPRMILAPATSWSRPICAIAAAALNAGLTADCTAMDIRPDGTLVQIRPAFGGTLIAENICRSGHIQMATVRPGSFAPCTGAGRLAGREYINIPCNMDYTGSKRLCNEICSDSRANLTGSRIIVSGGMGVGSKENFEYLKELAQALGGAVGASRAAVNAGIAPYSCQIGQSGSIVRPDVYIAIGISGAVQHLAGIRTAKKIIAVNSDPKATIFGYADIGICADWRDFTQALLSEL